jgi:hypothetical protein
MKWHIIFWCTTLALSLCTNAQSFDLFNPDRGKKPSPPRPKSVSKRVIKRPLSNPFVRSHKLPSPRKRPPERKKPLPPQKDFELRGTSRIGDKRAVVLRGPDNKDFIQYFRSKDKESTPAGHTGVKIESTYQGYYLLTVEPREIKIEYPTESPCRKSKEEKGLICDEGGQTATLKLTHGKALPPQTSPTPKKPPQKTAAEKREENRKKRREIYKNFKRKVIKDEDVPPGMRVIRTPFGDRLVPIKD